MLYTNALKQLDMQDISIVLLLIENRSAKRVSEMLNVSQSSISYSLKKLRYCFDDKLFENSDGAMQPTARVLAIKPYLQNIMQCINQCAKEGAEQGSVLRQWNITAPEYFEILMLPTLLQQVRATGRNWSLSVSRLGKDLPINQLLASDTDVCFGFGPGYHQQHPLLGYRSLNEDSFVCLSSVPKHQPKTFLDIDEFCDAQHIFPTPWLSEKNMVDGWLEKQSRHRNIFTRANSYHAGVNILLAVPALIVIPKKIVATLNVPPTLKVLEPPAGFPTFTLDMIWSRERNIHSDFHLLEAVIEKIKT
ncbi:LysR family transcriptional regulator [Pseudomonas fragi]|uniref:LysR family transcriptional regulator n=1 Tax=Pseudomonas fragi TaxID=296 RepID=UPI001F16D594|nr:LysR family transcriptional regulator [Pseudomonas fragi]MCF6761294.1 LysR substrate-binding domain-containing protein [Pseudomonas fragi]